VTTKRRERLQPILWVGFLTLLIVGPWFLPGYVFGTDFAGPRHYPFPDSLNSYAGLQLALAVVALVVPAEVVGKLLIVSVLGTAGLAAYHALPVGRFAPRAAASVIYMFNPFVYDRLAYGQLTVLAGYSVLPLVALAVRRLMLEPRARRALEAAGVLALVGILDVHMAIVAAAFSGVLAAAYIAMEGKSPTQVVRLAQYILLTAFAALVASAYWLVPILMGVGSEARTLARIGAGDLNAFRTVADPRLGLLPNVLGLFGFWGESTGLFVSAKDFVTAWLAVLLVILALAIAGAVVGWRNVLPDFAAARPWVVGLVLAGVLATILDIGVSDPRTAHLVNLLDVVFPPYRGMRDAGKWAALLALAYAQLVPIAMTAAVVWTKQKLRNGTRGELAAAMPIAFVLVLQLYYGNCLLYGMHGQVRPSAYPEGWYAADRTLAADPHPGRAVFLPWHGYLALSFVKNTNQIVASPAPQFFSIPVVASQDLEIAGVAPPLDDQDQATIGRLVADAGRTDWAPVLAKRDFKYVLLAREVDWRDYGYLGSQVGLVLVKDYGSILVYRNLMWH
jgi:hypothetical protein